jgi:hypothetical protein
MARSTACEIRVCACMRSRRHGIGSVANRILDSQPANRAEPWEHDRGETAEGHRHKKAGRQRPGFAGPTPPSSLSGAGSPLQEPAGLV